MSKPISRIIDRTTNKELFRGQLSAVIEECQRRWPDAQYDFGGVVYTDEKIIARVEPAPEGETDESPVDQTALGVPDHPRTEAG